jgi:hypothetical protein
MKQENLSININNSNLNILNQKSNQTKKSLSLIEQNPKISVSKLFSPSNNNNKILINNKATDNEAENEKKSKKNEKQNKIKKNYIKII